MKTTRKIVLNRLFVKKVSMLNFLKIMAVFALSFEMKGVVAEDRPPTRVADSVSMTNEAVSAIKRLPESCSVIN